MLVFVGEVSCRKCSALTVDTIFFDPQRVLGQLTEHSALRLAAPLNSQIGQRRTRSRGLQMDEVGGLMIYSAYNIACFSLI